MYRLKQIIENAGDDRIINNDLKVESGIVYLRDDFKFTQGNWYENCGGVWVNTQGGVPDYECEEFDELLMEVENAIEERN